MSWDSPLSDVASLVLACHAAGPGQDQGLDLERVVVDMPVELGIGVDPAGVVTLGAAPPRQARSTTVMPVLHRLRVVVVREPADLTGRP